MRGYLTGVTDTSITVGDRFRGGASGCSKAAIFQARSLSQLECQLLALSGHAERR